jgi:hypothetical protein
MNDLSRRLPSPKEYDAHEHFLVSHVVVGWFAMTTFPKEETNFDFKYCRNDMQEPLRWDRSTFKCFHPKSFSSENQTCSYILLCPFLDRYIKSIDASRESSLSLWAITNLPDNINHFVELCSERPCFILNWREMIWFVFWWKLFDDL